MNFKAINKIGSLNNEELKNEILIVKKELFELRFKKATRQIFQSHSFVHLKYKLRLLLMLQGNKQNLKKNRRKLYTKGRKD
jgi:large subunit ribosomal protein L29